MGKPGPEDVIKETEEENKPAAEDSKDILKDEIVNPEDILISGMHVKDDSVKSNDDHENSDLKVLLTEENLLVGDTNIEEKVK